MPQYKRLFQNRQQSRAGVTLIETLMAIFVFGIVLAAITALFIIMLNTYFRYNAKTEMVTRAIASTDRISDTIRLAFSVESLRNIGGTDYSTDADTIVLKLASIDANGAPLAGSFDYIVFTPDAGDATRLLGITDADAASSRHDQSVLVAETLQDITFMYPNADPASSVNVSLELRFQTLAGHSTLTHATFAHAKLRNTP